MSKDLDIIVSRFVKLLISYVGEDTLKLRHFEISSQLSSVSVCAMCGAAQDVYGTGV